MSEEPSHGEEEAWTRGGLSGVREQEIAHDTSLGFRLASLTCEVPSRKGQSRFLKSWPTSPQRKEEARKRKGTAKHTRPSPRLLAPALLASCQGATPDALSRPRSGLSAAGQREEERGSGVNPLEPAAAFSLVRNRMTDWIASLCFPRPVSAMLLRGNLGSAAACSANRQRPAQVDARRFNSAEWLFFLGGKEVPLLALKGTTLHGLFFIGLWPFSSFPRSCCCSG